MQSRAMITYVRLAIVPWPQSIAYDTRRLGWEKAWPWVAGFIGLDRRFALDLLSEARPWGSRPSPCCLFFHRRSYSRFRKKSSPSGRLYVPLMMFVPLVVAGGLFGVTAPSGGWRGIALCIAVLGSLSYSRASLYRDPVALMEDAVRKSGDEISHSLLGVALFRTGRIDEATKQVRIALDINPKDLDDRINLCVILVKTDIPGRRFTT